MGLVASRVVHEGSYLLWFSYVALLGCASITSIYSIYISNKIIDKINYNKIIFTFISLIGFSFCVLSNYEDLNLWMDEYTQIANSTVDIIIGSTREQQPPGGYVLSNFLGFVFGYGKLSSKFTGFIPVFVSLYLVLISIFRKKYFYFFSTLITCFYMFDLDIRFLSLEGRSVGYGVMSMFFSALALKIYVEEKTKLNIIIFSFSLYLFLNSVGMQPLVILFAFGLSVLIMYFMSKCKNTEAGLIAVAIIVPTLLFLPIELNIIQLASKLNKFNNSFYENSIYWLQNVKLSNFYKYIKGNHTWSYWSGAIISITIILFFRNIKRSDYLYKAAGLTIFLWMIIFDFTFNVIVNWSLNRWYYYCFYVFSNVFIIYTISYYIKSFKINFLLAIGLLIMVIQSQTYSVYKQRTETRRDWESAYQFISKEHNPDRVYVVGYCNIGVFWCLDFYVGAEMYETINPEKVNGYINPKKKYLQRFQDNGMIWDDSKKIYHNKISIVIPKRRRRKKQYSRMKELSLNSIYKVDNIESFIVFTSEENSKDKNLNLLKWIIKNLDPIPENYYPYTIMIMTYQSRKNYPEMIRWIDKLLDINGMEKAYKRSVQGQRILKRVKSLREKYSK
jgi:hypothetical protein